MGFVHPERRLQKKVCGAYAGLLGESKILSLAADLDCDLVEVNKERRLYLFYKKWPCPRDCHDPDDAEVEVSKSLTSQNGVKVLFANSSIRLGWFGDGGASSSHFKFVLGSSCERLCLQEIIGLILACWGRVSVDFSAVDWKVAMKRSRSLDLLKHTHDEGIMSQWEACMPDGETVLGKVLLKGQPHEVSDQQKQFDLHELAKELLRMNANPNVKDTTGQSLLMTCVKKGKARAVQLLIRHDVEISKDALQEAVRSGTVDVVHSLLAAEKCMSIPLDEHDISLCGFAWLRLRDAGIDIEKADAGDPALQVGAFLEAVDILKILRLECAKVLTVFSVLFLAFKRDQKSRSKRFVF